MNKTGDFSSKELNEIRDLIMKNRAILMNQLEQFYSGKPVKAIRL